MVKLPPPTLELRRLLPPFQRALNALAVLLETCAWPLSLRLVVSATASLFNRVLAVVLLPAVMVELLVCSLVLNLRSYILTCVKGNTGAATGNGNANANGGAKNNGKNAAAGKMLHNSISQLHTNTKAR
jgi:hypothetical protein